MTKFFDEYKKEQVELFKRFLSKLDVFIETKALVGRTGVEVVYLHEPYGIDNVYRSRGVIKIGREEYPVEVIFDVLYGEVNIRSKVFQYTLTSDEMIKFVNSCGSRFLDMYGV